MLNKCIGANIKREGHNYRSDDIKWNQRLKGAKNVIAGITLI